MLDCLAAHQIELVADVRRFPGSLRLPQFGQDALKAALGTRGMDYCWLEPLGGRRRPSTGAGESAWRNASFREIGRAHV